MTGSLNDTAQCTERSKSKSAETDSVHAVCMRDKLGKGHKPGCRGCDCPYRKFEFLPWRMELYSKFHSSEWNYIASLEAGK